VPIGDWAVIAASHERPWCDGASLISLTPAFYFLSERSIVMAGGPAITDPITLARRTSPL